MNGKPRDDLLNGEVFDSLLEAQVLAKELSTVTTTGHIPSSAKLAQLKFAEPWPQTKPGS
jgi:hypothetical protein